MSTQLFKKSLQVAVSTLACASLSALAAGQMHHTHHSKKMRHMRHHKSAHASQIAVHSDRIRLKLTPEQSRHFEQALQHQANLTTGLGSPVASIGAPNAFGATATSFFVTGSYVNHWPGSTAEDGFMNFGATLGDAYRYVGLTVNVALTSLGINNNSFGSNGMVGLRFNRYFTQNTAVAVGVAAIDGWGAAKNIANSFYAAVTHSFHLWLPMAVNAGLGTGGFNSRADVLANRDNNISGFVGLGVTVCKGLSLITDYAASEVNFGATYVVRFSPSWPLFVSLAGKNLNKHNGRAYFQGTAGLAYVLS